MVTILTSKYPDRSADFMMYLRTIVKARRSFVGDRWVSYDTVYSRKTAATKSLDWSQLHYTMKLSHRQGKVSGKMSLLLKRPACFVTLEPCFLLSNNSQSRFPQSNKLSLTIYGFFNSLNGNQCIFTPCRFDHVRAPNHNQNAIIENSHP